LFEELGLTVDIRISPQARLLFPILRLAVRFLSADLPAERRRSSLMRIAALDLALRHADLVPVAAGGVPAAWINVHGNASRRVICYLHGGGYTHGSIATHADLAARIARASGARALVIGYRLAPEHRFPAAVEDVLAAYRWLLENGGIPECCAFAGDSAGGGLVLATMVALRDAGLPLPAAGVCLSPATDLTGSGDTMRTNDCCDILPAADIPKFARQYLGDIDPRHPLASPLYADLHGLPPLLLQAGGAEVLLADSTRLAERARAAGVDVTLQVWPGMPHVWQGYAAAVPEGRQAIARIGEWVRAHVRDDGGLAGLNPGAQSPSAETQLQTGGCLCSWSRSGG
jgi:epsilon-lactone hydrolase